MDNDIVFNSMRAIPNKLLQEDGRVTDMKGKEVISSSLAYNSARAVPNKFLNPDGTYSTLDEIISQEVDTDIFIIVDELPDTGKPQKIYLVPNGKGGFDEYHYVDGKWDPVGSVDIDLSNYPTRAEVSAAIASALDSAKQYTDTQITGALNNSY